MYGKTSHSPERDAMVGDVHQGDEKTGGELPPYVTSGSTALHDLMMNRPRRIRRN